MSILSGATKGLLQGGLDVWNGMADKVWGILEKNPTTIGSESGGTAVWNILANGVQPIMIGVGTALVGVFFFWGWLKNSVDVREDMRLENILRMLLRLCLAQFLVLNNFKIMGLFFTAGANLIKPLKNFAGSGGQMSISTIETTVNQLHFWECIVVMIVGVFFFIITAVLSVMLVLAVVNRFLKVFIAVPLGTLAFSTFAGDREIAHSSSSYFKYALALAIEGAAIGLALIASAAIISSITLFGGGDGIGGVLLWMVEKVFQIAATLGIVKGIQEIISRVFGI